MISHDVIENYHVHDWENESFREAPHREIISVASIEPLKPKFTQNFIQSFKRVQQEEQEKWKGLEIDSIGIPGVVGLGKEMHKQMPKIIQKNLEREDDILKALEKIFLDERSKNAPVPKYSWPIIDFPKFNDSRLLNEDYLGNALRQYKDTTNNRDLLFKMGKFDCKLVKSMLLYRGFFETEGHDWNVMWTNGNIMQYQFDNLSWHQKINHFPSSYEITHKDKLWTNIRRMQTKFPNEFNFIPQTFIMPKEFPEFFKYFNELKNKNSPENLWIVKPCAMSQGKGIFLIKRPTDIPIEENYVVCKYISNPLLINNLKFDLRVYALVTNYHPLTVYVYNEGLVRFATEEYSSGNGSAKGNPSEFNRFVYLTNYSVNKKHDKFVNNNNLEHDDVGNKWSFGGLFKHLDFIGVDTKLLWSKIYDIIIKTFISVEEIISMGLKNRNSAAPSVYNSNCFELYGFDILVDDNLKPWLLEVNLSPSLACDSPLDFHIKSNLIRDTFNLICLRHYDKKKEFPQPQPKNYQFSFNYRQSQPRNQTNHFSLKNIQKSNINKIIPISRSTVINAKSPGMKSINKRIQEVDKFSTPNKDQDDLNDNSFYEFCSKRLDSNKKASSEDIPNYAILNKLLKLPSKLREIIYEVLVQSSRKSNYIRIYPSHGCDQYDQFFSKTKSINKILYRFLFSTMNNPNDSQKEPEKTQDKITDLDEHMTSPSLHNSPSKRERDTSPVCSVYTNRSSTKMSLEQDLRREIMKETNVEQLSEVSALNKLAKINSIIRIHLQNYQDACSSQKVLLGDRVHQTAGKPYRTMDTPNNNLSFNKTHYPQDSSTPVTTLVTHTHSTTNKEGITYTKSFMNPIEGENKTKNSCQLRTTWRHKSSFDKHSPINSQDIPKKQQAFKEKNTLKKETHTKRKCSSNLKKNGEVPFMKNNFVNGKEKKRGRTIFQCNSKRSQENKSDLGSKQSDLQKKTQNKYSSLAQKISVQNNNSHAISHNNSRQILSKEEEPQSAQKLHSKVPLFQIRRHNDVFRINGILPKLLEKAISKY